jgi:PAS domain S-box-containing protein
MARSASPAAPGGSPHKPADAGGRATPLSIGQAGPDEGFRRLADHATDLIYRLRLDPDMAFEYVSPSSTALTGYTPEEFYADPGLGMHIVHPEDRPLVRRAMAPDPTMFEGPAAIRWIRKDGEIRWIELTNNLIVNDAAGTSTIEGIARDVTARVSAERALAHRVKELTCVSAVTREANADPGPDELSRRVAEHLVPAMQFPEVAVASVWLEASRHVTGARLPLHAIRAWVEIDGRLRGEVAVGYREDRPFLQEEQELVGLVAETLRLWMERRDASRAVHISEERFRRLAENAPDMVYRFRFEPTWGIDYISPAAERLTGYSLSEIRTDPDLVWRVVHPDDREHLAERMREPGAGPLLLRWIRKDGTVIWTEGRSTLIQDDRGRVVAAEGIARDVTDRVRAEAELRSTVAQLNELDAERRRLLHSLVEAQEEERRRIAADIHDDPVQVMTATAIRLGALRLRIQDPGLASEVERLEKTAQRAIVRLRHLLFELRPPALDHEGLGPTLRMHLDALAAEDQVVYRLDDRLEEDPPRDVRVILYRIAQEALANARKHALATEVVVELEDVNRGLALRVRDDGVGFRADQTKGRPPERLGLISIRERAEMAGGWCRVWSSPGKGTIVECWIPLAERPTDGPA